MREERAVLKKALSSMDVLATGLGALIGWGWIVAFGSMIQKAGVLGLILGFAIGGTLMLTIGLTCGELSSSMPVTAGGFAFTLKALGVKHAYWCGCFMAISYIALLMFEAVSIPVIFATLWPRVFEVMPLYTVAGFKVYLPQVILGILVSFLWYGINYVGAKLYGIVQTVMIVIFIVLGFCTVGLSLYKGNPAFFIENMWGNLSPIKGIVSILALAGFFYIGFDMIPQAAEEYKAEPKKLARLIQGSIIVGTIWYMLIGCMIAFQIPKSELPNLSLPAASAVARTWGQAGFYIVLFLGIIGIVTTYSASFYSSSRVLFGLARGKLFPKGFAKLHPKHGTPTLPITIAAIASIIAVFLGRAAVMWFLDATSAFVVLFYLYIACSYITLRKQEPEMNRPYRAPGGILTGIVAVGASIFFFLSLILPFSPGALIWPYEYAIFIIFLIIATIIYVLMAPTLKDTPVKEYEWLVLGIEGDKEK